MNVNSVNKLCSLITVQHYWKHLSSFQQSHRFTFIKLNISADKLSCSVIRLFLTQQPFNLFKVCTCSCTYCLFTFHTTLPSSCSLLKGKFLVRHFSFQLVSPKKIILLVNNLHTTHFYIPIDLTAWNAT